MKLLPYRADRVRTCVLWLAGLALALAFIAGARAQNETSADAKAAPRIVETIHLTHATAQRDLNDIQTDLRNMLPNLAIYGIQTQNAISLRGTAEEVESAKKTIAELDRPKKSYRITFTFTEIDNGRPVNVQHLSVIVVSGEKSTVKRGNRVPIVTGMFDKDSAEKSSKVQYLDVGLNIEASLDGDRLRSKLEQSSVADEKSGIGVQDPIVSQTMVEATSDLKPGKNVLVGSIDLPGTTRRQEIEVLAEMLQ